VTWQQRGARKGKRRIPEAQRQRIIKAAKADGIGCFFKFPLICTGLTGKVEVHHVIDAEDGGGDDDDNLVAACKPCHQHYSARQSQRRAVAAAWDWKRKPERHPGVLD
jgi:5-methylcytosine-specific restriction endonuclease McrA